jgi:hypothetical protein
MQELVGLIAKPSIAAVNGHGADALFDVRSRALKDVRRLVSGTPLGFGTHGEFA